MFSYPGGTGPKGHWSFSASDYTPTDDFREIWWDPKKVSRQNNKAGSWVELNAGKRYTAATAPQGHANYFEGKQP
jgi:hypothetical protein